MQMPPHMEQIQSNPAELKDPVLRYAYEHRNDPVTGNHIVVYTTILLPVLLLLFVLIGSIYRFRVKKHFFSRKIKV